MVYRSSFGRGFQSNVLNRYVLSLISCLVSSLILFTLSLTNSESLKSLRYNTISFSEPFLVIVGNPLDILNNSFMYFKELKEAKEINTHLINENKRLNMQLDKNNFLILENYRLKKLLKIDETDYVIKITARVLIDPYKDGGSIIYIDVGKNDGLKINDIVFNENGLLGRIIELGSFSSKVMTIFNENSVIPVLSVKSKKSFFVEGSKSKLKPKHIEKMFDLDHGEIVVTTDAAGYFKEGIKIGRVVKTLNEVFVVPFAKKTDSIYVNVLIYNFKNEFKD